MIGLSKSTEFGRRIPKQKFYEHISVTPALKRLFIDQIKVIWWSNKIAASTMNIPAGNSVTEIEVFRIELTSKDLDSSVLLQIDREIPYHILFLLENEGQYQAWIAFKESADSGKNAFRVEQYYHTEWMEETALPLHIEGLDLDAVYENFVRQIGGDVLATSEPETLRDSVERDKQRQVLEKQIKALQAKIRKEKQFNRQVEMSTELKRLRKELELI